MIEQINRLKLILLSIFVFQVCLPSSAQFVPIGNGSYTTQFPGVDQAGRNSYPSGTPYLSGEAANKAVPTNDWFSNFVKEAHGGQAFNYPLSYLSKAEGLVVNLTKPRAGSPIEYREPMSDVEAVRVGVKDLQAPNSTLSDFGDWTVTFSWENGNNSFNALLGHGMPFSYFTKGDNDLAHILVGFHGEDSYADGNKIIIENGYNGGNFIVFAPTGSTWEGTNGDFTSDLNGQNYWSMVLIPEGMSTTEAISLFEPYAFVFPASSKVDWSYDQNTGIVTTDYTITPEVKEGNNDTVFWGILPHHWGHLTAESAQPTAYSYATVRGELKMIASNTFSTELRFSGILPAMPDVAKYSDSYNPAELFDKIDAMKSEGLSTWTDSYNEGQSMNRLVQTARIADQLGFTEARDELLSTVRERLEDWLSAEGGEIAFLFYYIDEWNALIGYPAGHRQDSNLNDHHFHWGYFIHSAAVLEQYYPGWAEKWGDMINLLVKDAANPTRDEQMFPFLRNFSPYAGHSWANGMASEPFGNDQESTSESMQFNSSLIHWGTVTGNTEIRDLGIYLYVTEQSSVNEYWFDQNERVFQPEYIHEMVARVWGAGYDNGTWWTTDIAASYGIQLYPIHSGSLYLGHNTDYIQKVWNGMTAKTEILDNVPNDNLWYDTYWKFISFLDAEYALDLYNNYTERSLKFGISDAQTYHWLHTMVALGQVDPSITADYPITAVFNKDGEKTYTAHNYGNEPITVHFSDGYQLEVPAYARATSRDASNTINITADEIEVAVGGSVTLNATVIGDVNSVEFYQDGQLIGTVTEAPYTITVDQLTAGYLAFHAKAINESTINMSNFIRVLVGTQQAYGGTPVNLPGTIETGNYDTFEGAKGQGITYVDVTTWNEGGYRPEEAVDASITNGEGATVGWIEAGEWLEYTVNIQQQGEYKANIRFSNGNNAQEGPFHFKIDGVKISDDIYLNSSADWDNWATKTVENINLKSGEHILQIYMDNGGFNLGKITFEHIAGTETPEVSSLEVTPSLASIDNGQTLQFTAQGFDQFGDEITVNPVWSIDGGGNIDENGLFTATTTGIFTVTASEGNISGTTQIKVLGESELRELIITPTNPNVVIGTTLQFTADGKDQFGENMDAPITWSIDGGTIDENGFYQANTLGTFTVTATSGDIEKTTTITVSRANLALNKQVMVSSIENGGTVGNNAVDGSLSTRWSSEFEDPQWIYVDLGKTYDIDQVVLYWEGAYGKAYEIQISSDANNWTNVFTEENSNGGMDEINFSARGQYVRVYGTARGTIYGYSLFELEVYGTEIPAEPDTESPSTPTGLSANNISGTSLTLSWEASTDNVAVTEYEIYQDGQSVATTNQTRISITGLTLNTSYTFTVIAKDASGNLSSESESLTVTTKESEDTEAPSTPTNLSASEITETSLTLTWDASTDNIAVTEYEVRQDGVVVITTAETNITITGLTANTSYNFTVVAKDATANASSESESLTVTTEVAKDTQAPSAPTNLRTSEITETSLTLTWDASTDNIAVTEYEVLQDGIAVGTTAETSISITGLTANTNYNFTVVAKDQAGNISVSSSVLSVKTLRLTSNDNVLSDTEFKLYPNPSEGNSFIIQMNALSTTTNIEIVDMKGQKVRFSKNQLNDHLIKITFSKQLVKGVYIVHVITNNEIYNQKLVVN
ncbi:glycosyl hydrolase [Sediminitomix flava]|uniref:glucan endo-1,3-beta-D-glucosidase n=1 Tax=Sediminitomix flava TaxID=379075 RepID=A0A315ZG26_SEDFL|nr:glycosyl hydrolase [Sediminitomix flava]PWJ44272.1 putative secreted protein (Por secretion system target) [Sediminitomix flava]